MRGQGAPQPVGLVKAARLYAEAARKAPDLAERDHLTRQAARLNTLRPR